MLVIVDGCGLLHPPQNFISMVEARDTYLVSRDSETSIWVVREDLWKKWNLCWTLKNELSLDRK